MSKNPEQALNDGRPVALLNGRVIDPETGLDTRGGLLMHKGIIIDVGAHVSSHDLPEGAHIMDVQGHVIAPGLIDMRVFVGEPGGEYKETLKTASEAAAAGGVTTFVCMPDTRPALDGAPTIDYVRRRSRDTAIVNILPSGAITKQLMGLEITEMGLMQEAGAVLFTDGAHVITNPMVMRRAMTYACDFDALIMHHVEDPFLAGNGVMNEGERALRLGLPGIPKEAETIMLARDVRLARLTGARYHAAMISCADSVDIMRRAKAHLPLTCGVSINSLSFNENDIGDYRTFLKLSPPVRNEEERQHLIAALAEGVIDVIVSDHNPQDVETKRLPFAEAANGAVGMQTLLSAALRLVHAGHISMINLLAAMTIRPAQVLGIDAGRLQKGAPADVIVFDPDHAWVCDKSRLWSRAKNSPFDEARMEGRVFHTFVAGHQVLHTDIVSH
jgi:dihydroorotase